MCAEERLSAWNWGGERFSGGEGFLVYKLDPERCRRGEGDG